MHAKWHDNALGCVLVVCVMTLVVLYATNPVLYITQVEFTDSIRNRTCSLIPPTPTVLEMATVLGHMQLVCNGYRSEIRTLYSTTVWFTTSSLFYMACNFAANHNRRARSPTFWSAGLLTTIVHVFTIQYLDTAATVWGNVFADYSTTHVYHTHTGIATYCLVGTVLSVCLLGVMRSIHIETTSVLLPTSHVVRNSASVQFLCFTTGWIGLFLCCMFTHFFDAILVRPEALWMQYQQPNIGFHVFELLPQADGRDPFTWNVRHAVEIPNWMIGVTFALFLSVKLLNLVVPLTRSLFVFAFSVACTWQAVQTWMFSTVSSTFARYGYDVELVFSLRTVAFLAFGTLIMIGLAAEDDLSLWDPDDGEIETQSASWKAHIDNNNNNKKKEKKKAEKHTEGEDFTLLFSNRQW